MRELAAAAAAALPFSPSSERGKNEKGERDVRRQKPSISDEIALLLGPLSFSRARQDGFLRPPARLPRRCRRLRAPRAPRRRAQARRRAEDVRQLSGSVLWRAAEECIVIVEGPAVVPGHDLSPHHPWVSLRGESERVYREDDQEGRRKKRGREREREREKDGGDASLRFFDGDDRGEKNHLPVPLPPPPHTHTHPRKK